MDDYPTHLGLVRAGKSLRVATLPTPRAPPGGILVAPRFVGVCGTDLQILNGTRPDTAEVLGHEGGGVVIESDAGRAFHERQPVVFNPSAQLPQGRILGHNFSGLFQEFIPIDAKELADGLVQPLEDGLTLLQAPLVEPVAGVIYACDLIYKKIPTLRSAVVFGAGPTGLITTAYLTDRGVRVLLVHTTAERLDTAQRAGLIESDAAMVSDPDLVPRILQWNGGQPLDAALICTSMKGAPAALRDAIEVLRDGGCIELVSNISTSDTTPEGVSAVELRAIRGNNLCGEPEGGAYVVAQTCGREIAFTSHRGTSRQHMSQAMEVLRARPERYAALITHVLTLREAADAIATLADSRRASIGGRDVIKAVVEVSRQSSPIAH